MCAVFRPHMAPDGTCERARVEAGGRWVVETASAVAPCGQAVTTVDGSVPVVRCAAGAPEGAFLAVGCAWGSCGALVVQPPPCARSVPGPAVSNPSTPGLSSSPPPWVPRLPTASVAACGCLRATCGDGGCLCVCVQTFCTTTRRTFATWCVLLTLQPLSAVAVRCTCVWSCVRVRVCACACACAGPVRVPLARRPEEPCSNS
jgi:hypothetical protein